MKRKNILLALLIPVMGLMSCGPSNPSFSEVPDQSSSSEPASTSSMPLGKEITVYFFISGPTADLDAPFYSMPSNEGAKIQKPTKDPILNNPAYNTFLGWSDKVVAIDADDIWDFDTDTIPRGLKKPYYHLYGQWDYIEK